MARSTQPIPPGMRAVTPQLVVEDATQYIEFLSKALGAEPQHIMPGPGGKGVMHGYLKLGDSVIFISDAGGFAKRTTTNLFVYVADVDAAFKRAVDGGARVVMPVADMFWGDRWCMVEDPAGNQWQIATHVEDVSPEDMKQRMAAAAAQAGK